MSLFEVLPYHFVDTSLLRYGKIVFMYTLMFIKEYLHIPYVDNNKVDS